MILEIMQYIPNHENLRLRIYLLINEKQEPLKMSFILAADSICKELFGIRSVFDSS